MLKGNLRAQWIELSLQNKKKNDKELKKNDKTHLKDKTFAKTIKRLLDTLRKYRKVSCIEESFLPSDRIHHHQVIR